MRTVGVKLVADVSAYVRNMKISAVETRSFEQKLADAAKAGDKTAKATEEIGREGPRALKLTERAASELDRQIDETRKSYEKLRDQFERTGDLDVFEAMNKELTKLDRQLKQRRGILGGGDGKASAEAFSLGFSQRIGPLLAAAPLSPPLIGAAAAAGPVVAATLAAAVTTGVGAAAVGAGLMIASRDPKVKAAGVELGKIVVNNLEGIVEKSGFEAEALKALSHIKREFRSARPDLEAIFANSAKLVQPLTRAATGFARELLPGIATAVSQAGPLFDVLEQRVPRIGAAFGQIIADFSRSAESSADAFAGLLVLAEASLLFAGKAITEIADKATLLGAGPLQFLGDLLGKDKAAATSEWANAFKDLAAAVGEANTQAVTYAETIRAQTDPQYALIKSQKDLAAAQREYNEAIKEHGRNSPEAREKLLALGQAAIAAQIAAQGAAGSFDGKLTPSMRATLRAANLTEAEIDALERQFIQAKKAGDAMAKTYRAKMVFETIGRPFSDYTGIGGSTTRGYSRGGMIEGSGPRGVDSVPIIGAPGEGVLNLRGMAAIGGERTLNALNAGSGTPTWDAPTWSAPDWSAYRPAGGGTQRVEVVARFVGPPGVAGDIGAALSRFIQVDVWDRGSGDVQRAYGKRA